MTFFFGIRSSRRSNRIFLFFDAFSLAFLLSAFMPSLAIQICLATPGLKNARQFVSGIFFAARARECKQIRSNYSAFKCRMKSEGLHMRRFTLSKCFCRKPAYSHGRKVNRRFQSRRSCVIDAVPCSLPRAKQCSTRMSKWFPSVQRVGQQGAA